MNATSLRSLFTNLWITATALGPGGDGDGDGDMYSTLEGNKSAISNNFKIDIHTGLLGNLHVLLDVCDILVLAS